jgi:hypothetical protein
MRGALRLDFSSMLVQDHTQLQHEAFRTYQVC